MKKTILSVMALSAALAATAQTDVLTIEFTDGSTKTFNVDEVKEMRFDTVQDAPGIAGEYRGVNTVNVGGQVSYETELAATITENGDGTINFTWPEYQLDGTVMGDMKLGSCTISNIAYDADKGGYYRDYSNDGVTQHMTATQNGVTTMDKDYLLGNPSTILIVLSDDGTLSVENPFKLGAMPLPLTATFSGKK